MRTRYFAVRTGQAFVRVQGLRSSFNIAADWCIHAGAGRNRYAYFAWRPLWKVVMGMDSMSKSCKGQQHEAQEELAVHCFDAN